jgi:ADP-heptose:LPS heptosyltransferase
MNIKFMKSLKLLDALAGTLVSLIPRPVQQDLGKLSHDRLRLLIIRPGGIGDAALLIPALLAIKKNVPGSTIDILAEKRNSAVFSLCPEINRTYHYDKPKELLGTLLGRYNVVVDTEQWHRLSAIVARFTRSPMSVGYGTNERARLFTDIVQYSHEDYEVASFLDLIVSIAGIHQFDSDKPFLIVPGDCAESIRPLLRSLGNRSIIAIFPGGSIAERRWSSGRFHQTAKLLHEKGYGVVVVGGKEDMRAGEEIISGLPDALNFCGRLTLPETAAILKDSVLLITGDSGIMHIGYGLGIKVLALFGPGREKKWAPRGKNCKVINKNLSCSPCTTFGYTPKCQNNAACMSAITVEELVREALALLDVY